jgi:MSHA pilin protein MshD
MKGSRKLAGLPRKNSGFTLMELVVAITILTIAVSGTLLGIEMATRHNADPLVLQQGIAIAQSYLEEITSKQFPTAALPCSSAVPATRAQYSSVCDYRNIGSQVPTNQLGNPINGLGGYTVTIVINSSTANINGLTSAANQAIRIDIQVSHPNMTTMTFSAYRTRY